MTMPPETSQHFAAESAEAFDPAVPPSAALRDRLGELAGEAVRREGLSAPVDPSVLEDLGRLGALVAEWFQPDELIARPAGTDPASWLARDVLGAGGKRLRPLLAVGTWEALTSSTEHPKALRTVALSVECFHKASLVHDDIEDGDAVRNGRPALHVRQGLAQAVNTGDLLLGLGYRLLAGLDVPADLRGDMLAVAASAHLRLSVGQGRELDWMHRPRPLDVEDLLEIAAGKTAPAFEVAIRLGSLLAERHKARNADFAQTVGEFARALGQAYQLRDDLLDADDVRAGRLNMLAAVGSADAPPDLEGVLDRWWRGGTLEDAEQADLEAYLNGEEVRRRALGLLGAIRRRVDAALQRIEPHALRAMLRQMFGRCLADLAPPACCDPDVDL